MYHINAVDEVTQWQVVACTPAISEAWLLPVLASMLDQFPFEIRNFHSDNGSEFINHELLRYCAAQHITFTRAREAVDISRGASGTIFFILAAQFMAVIMLAASIAPDYDFNAAAISDLGVIRETALLFNASLVAVGLLNIAGGYLFYRSHGRRWVLAMFLLAGLGATGAGLVPLNASDLHGIFALVAFLFFNLEAIAVATVVSGPMRWISILAGVAGLDLRRVQGVDRTPPDGLPPRLRDEHQRLAPGRGLRRRPQAAAVAVVRPRQEGQARPPRLDRQGRQDHPRPGRRRRADAAAHRGLRPRTPRCPRARPLLEAVTRSRRQDGLVRAGERGKQRGMDVQDGVGERRHEGRRDQAHVAGEADQRHPMRAQDVGLSSLPHAIHRLGNASHVVKEANGPARDVQSAIRAVEIVEGHRDLAADFPARIGGPEARGGGLRAGNVLRQVQLPADGHHLHELQLRHA